MSLGITLRLYVWRCRGGTVMSAWRSDGGPVEVGAIDCTEMGDQEFEAVVAGMTKVEPAAELNPAPTLEIAYADGRKDEREDTFKRLVPLLKELHDNEVLSEQQCAAYLDTDLVTWRKARGPL